MAEALQSPESRLYAAGFTRQLEFWVTPDGSRVLNMEDAIRSLDCGEVKPGGWVMRVPEQPGLRARTDDEMDRLLRPPPPPWFEPLAELVAEKLRPVVRSEVRAALKGGGRV